jgi:hypothetical protein
VEVTDLELDERRAAALPQDHVQDFVHPSGNALNVCEHCLKTFRGMRFRLLCSLCQL